MDDVLGLSAGAGLVLSDKRSGRNGRHSLTAQFRQSVFGRLAGYEDVNDADRLGHDPAMRWVVGGRAMRDDPAQSWMWTAAEVAGGAVARATDDEVRAVFPRLVASTH